MANFKLPYYKGHINLEIADDKLAGVLVSKAEEYKVTQSESDIVRAALEHPIESESLANLAKEKKHIVIISSDHTRPVPSHITMPLLYFLTSSNNKGIVM